MATSFVRAFVFNLLILSSVSIHSANEARPNILVLLADDMGYGDMGFMGSKHLQTPHLDALAKSGVFCSQGYVASPVCSPSRAGLMTGRDPRRFGYEGNLNNAAANYATRPELLGLPPGEHTLGDHLRAAGYATALIGKWHLGIGAGFHPNERGFDYFCGMLGGSHGYFPKPDNHKLERNGEPLREFFHPYLTDFFTADALEWLNRQKGEAKPWFLFLSYNAPHGPMHATEEDLAHFPHIEDKKRRTYAAMMYALDRGIGRIRKWLEAEGEEKNTLMVFFSDNGGATGNASWNGKLSGAKGNLREGGVRVPMIWNWPGTLPGGRHYDSPASSLDLLPSFLAACDAKPLALRQPLSHEDKRNFASGVKKYGAYDGVNLLPYLKGDKPPVERTLFWRLQGQTAIRTGGDKLIRLSHRPAQLFRPGTDIGEANDLSGVENGRFESLFRQLADWETTLPTMPLWGSSPYWIGESAKQYDEMKPRPEPR